MPSLHRRLKSDLLLGLIQTHSEILKLVRADCTSNGVESQILPVVRPPVKPVDPAMGLSADGVEQSNSRSSAGEAWLEEAHREAGFSKPFTVSLCLRLLHAGHGRCYVLNLCKVPCHRRQFFVCFSAGFLFSTILSKMKI